MPERFIDEAWIKGDFKKATTSASQAGLTDHIWFIKHPYKLYAKFQPEKPSISLKAGGEIHTYFQKILSKQLTLKQAKEEFLKLRDLFSYSEKELAKFDFIYERLEQYINNHINALIEISKNVHMEKWIYEEFHSVWYDEKYLGKKLGVETEMYIDATNPSLKLQSEHKNRFGSTYKYKSKKDGIETWKWRKAQKIKSPQFTHCIQEAVYMKSLPNYKPHLVYVDEENYTIFNQDNCYELSPAGLKYFFNKYIQINVRRQEMLRMADGDIRKLAMMIGIDWSEIRNRENNPILNTIQEEDIQKLEEFYDGL